MKFQKLVLVFALVLSASVSVAGSWMSDFENRDLGEWNLPAGTTAEDYLTNVYNHTLSEGSTSLELRSDELTSGISRSYTNLLTSTGGTSAWFYDDGADLTNFRLGAIEQLATDGPSTTNALVGIGVEDNLAGINTPYLAYYDTVASSTGLMRSVGWHRVQVDWGIGRPPGLILDETQMSQDLVTTSVGGVAFVVQTQSAGSDGNTTPTRVWVDDVTAEIDMVPYSFSEDFESPDALVEWSSFGPIPNAKLDNTHNHTSSNGSSTSLLAQGTPDQPTVGTIRTLGMSHNRGYLSTYFYDSGTTTSYFEVRVGGVSPNQFLPADDFTLGITNFDSTSGTADYMVTEEFGQSNQTTSTGIARSIGWHHIEAGNYGGAGLKIRLDGIEFPGNTFPELGSIDNIIVTDNYIGGSAEPNDGVWLDDLDYHLFQNMPNGTSEIGDWREFE